MLCEPQCNSKALPGQVSLIRERLEGRCGGFELTQNLLSF